MNIFKNFVYAIFALTLLISCKDSKPAQEQATEAPTETATQPEKEVVATPPPLADTIGLYKLNNAEARTFVVEMNKVLSDIEKAMNDNAPARMPALLTKQRELQQKQLSIQSALNETDRELFKVYANKIAERLLAMAKKMETM